MADNAQKTPFARGLNEFGQKKARDAIAILGKALPCSVAAVVSSGIVTVNFQITSPYTIPNINCPIFGPEYIRYPTQAGALGVVFPIDVYLGGVSGLGGGVADLTQRATLSSLVFFPIGNKNWTPTDDPNSLVLYGPDGAILRTMDKSCQVKVTENGIPITLPAGKTIVITSLPTSSAGLQSGSLWRNGTGVAIVP